SAELGLADASESGFPEETENLAPNDESTDRQSLSTGHQHILIAGNPSSDHDDDINQEISSTSPSEHEGKPPRPDPSSVDRRGPRSRTTAGQKSATSNVTTTEAKNKSAQESKSGSTSAIQTPNAKSPPTGTRTQLSGRLTSQQDTPVSPSAPSTKTLKRHHDENDVEEKDDDNQTPASPAKKARGSSAAAIVGNPRFETDLTTPSAPAPAVKEGRVEKRGPGRPAKGRGRGRGTGGRRK
ncbi:MAG: hypothetical protein Q9183_001576, partial [Haloplaca sp. 2 TL-2023]